MSDSTARFTVYDVMEQKGVFRRNPANMHSRDENGAGIYKKQEFPRMVYHPEGKEIVLVPGQPEDPKMAGSPIRGEIKETIHRQVASEEELDAALAAGWHLHPADAMKAAGKEAPARSAADRASAAEDEVAALKRKLAETEEALAAVKGPAPNGLFATGPLA